eukprot:743186-Rhodomonas_salina.1
MVTTVLKVPRIEGLVVETIAVSDIQYVCSKAVSPSRTSRCTLSSSSVGLTSMVPKFAPEIVAFCPPAAGALLGVRSVTVAGLYTRYDPASIHDSISPPSGATMVKVKFPVNPEDSFFRKVTLISRLLPRGRVPVSVRVTTTVPEVSSPNTGSRVLRCTSSIRSSVATEKEVIELEITANVEPSMVYDVTKDTLTGPVLLATSLSGVARADVKELGNRLRLLLELPSDIRPALFLVITVKKPVSPATG